jgi:predicted MPP superfamily phosphohydrolase
MVRLQETMDAELARLESRLGRVYARQRVGIERDHEAQIFGQGLNFFHIESWYSIHSVIRNTLRLIGLYERGRRNAERVELRHNYVQLKTLRPEFEGYRILHISDMHADMSRSAMRHLVQVIAPLQYDICVLTGDFRGKTFGPYQECLAGVAQVHAELTSPVYGVLGNHDTIRMVPALEEMGIRMLLNEVEVIARGGHRLYLAGIDDAHYYRVDNIEKVASLCPHEECSILLSHTPEIYRQAAHAGFSLLLGGHTHGGQICLPGSIPITLDSVLPRHLGSGAWTYQNMHGYTSTGAGSSIVPVRLNCPPEVTLHHLAGA